MSRTDCTRQVDVVLVTRALECEKATRGWPFHPGNSQLNDATRELWIHSIRIVVRRFPADWKLLREWHGFPDACAGTRAGGQQGQEKPDASMYVVSETLLMG